MSNELREKIKRRNRALRRAQKCRNSKSRTQTDPNTIQMKPNTIQRCCEVLRFLTTLRRAKAFFLMRGAHRQAEPRRVGAVKHTTYLGRDRGDLDDFHHGACSKQYDLAVFALTFLAPDSHQIRVGRGRSVFPHVSSSLICSTTSLIGYSGTPRRRARGRLASHSRTSTLSGGT